MLVFSSAGMRRGIGGAADYGRVWHSNVGVATSGCRCPRGLPATIVQVPHRRTPSHRRWHALRTAATAPRNGGSCTGRATRSAREGGCRASITAGAAAAISAKQPAAPAVLRQPGDRSGGSKAGLTRGDRVRPCAPRITMPLHTAVAHPAHRQALNHATPHPAGSPWWHHRLCRRCSVMGSPWW